MRRERTKLTRRLSGTFRSYLDILRCSMYSAPFLKIWMIKGNILKLKLSNAIENLKIQLTLKNKKIF
jgi:hypothetical protein